MRAMTTLRLLLRDDRGHEVEFLLDVPIILLWSCLTFPVKLGRETLNVKFESRSPRRSSFHLIFDIRDTDSKLCLDDNLIMNVHDNFIVSEII